MKIKMILPALTEAKSPFWRPIKYSLFPPLGLATLAGYCSPDDEIDLQDEHVEELRLDDHPDLILIQIAFFSARAKISFRNSWRIIAKNPPEKSIETKTGILPEFHQSAEI